MHRGPSYPSNNRIKINLLTPTPSICTKIMIAMGVDTPVGHVQHITPPLLDPCPTSAMTVRQEPLERGMSYECTR